MDIENIAPNTAQTQAGKSKKGGRTVEQIYQKKTQLEHILLRPDTYVGSVEKITQPMWVYDRATSKIVNRPTTFVPGLYKIFDEIVVNAVDNKQRDPSMDKLEVTIDQATNTIRVLNNGNGIPIVMHQEHGCYVPELIFGHLLTGSNFDDDEKKTTGGRNGYGAKLANIFSSRFIVETADGQRGLRFRQEFRNNMAERGEAEVTRFNGSDFTCITFSPDLARFKMDELDDDTVALLSKRVFDMAGCASGFAGPRLKVTLNNTRLPVKSFQEYIGLYEGMDNVIGFERVNERWEIGIGISDGAFQQISFVNAICTTKGGQHVNFIADKVAQRLVPVVKRKNKGEEVKGHVIKNHLAIFVNCLIENPAFDSQTKENLTTRPTQFGSTCELTDKLYKAIEKSAIVDNIVSWAKFKQTEQLKKKGGSKRSKVLGITKLDDANFAGTAKARDCTLILTEGDSAKALAISGLGIVGRDYYGVFPLRGKPLNVREASHQQIMKNEEIQNICRIMGLQFGKEYTDTSSLRYGHLVIMADQDHDGSHIKGLIINLIHYFWPSLLRVEGFLQEFITPIVKCTKGSQEKRFYTIPEYEAWKEANDNARQWKIKYYKGLGTSTAQEAREYFSDLRTHLINFGWQDNAADQIDMAFSKKRANERKDWLRGLQQGTYVDYAVDVMSYDEFINKELILFSHADNQRSIPHFMDGLKPAQRKVLFSCFKRNLKSEIKVAQLAGYISEHSAYHHGEASLSGTIINMAQSFIGTNNINLLTPSGQFGTRLMGGKDAASPRYVFTKLEAITRAIFHPDDDALLNYLNDDGQSIEPDYYAPVIPMVLVNGAEGIGTGWSTSVPTFNPRQIIANLRRLLQNEHLEEMIPWYRGFTGQILPKPGREEGCYVVVGTIEKVDEVTLRISELPVGKWTHDYKSFLETLLPGQGEDKEGFIKDFKENHTDTEVLFTLTVVSAAKLAEAEAAPGGLYRKLKLESTVSTTNMHMFELDEQITKFETVESIMRRYFEVRLEMYSRRKDYLLEKLNSELDKLANKVRFIKEVIAGTLVVSNRRKDELLAELQRKGYKTFFPVSSKHKEAEPEEGSEEEKSSADDASPQSLSKGYDYLLSMKIWSLTWEKVMQLQAELDAKREEVEMLQRTAPADIWLKDLDALEVALDEFEHKLEVEKVAADRARRKNGGMAGAPRRGATKKSKKKTYDDSESEQSDYDSDGSDFGAKRKPKAAPKAKATTYQVVEYQPMAAPVKRTKATKASSDDVDSLSQHMEASLAVSPPPKAPKTAKAATGGAKKAAGAAAKPAAAAAARKPKKVIDLVSDEDSENDSGEDDIFDTLPPRPQRTARPAAMKKNYVIEDSEDDEEFHANDDDDEDDDEYHANDDLQDEDEFLPKKGTKASKPSKTAAATSKPAKAPKQTATKRATKTAATTADNAQALYSPARHTPQISKRARNSPQDENDDEDYNPVLQLAVAASKPAPKTAAAKPAAKAAKASKPAATKKAVAPKPKPAAAAKSSKAAAKPKASKKHADSDEDDEEVAMVSTPVKKSPKPARRARAATNYAQYYDDSDEEEVDDDQSEEASDIDDDDSDF